MRKNTAAIQETWIIHTKLLVITWAFQQDGKHKINQAICLWRPRNTPVFVGVRRGWLDMLFMCLSVCTCVFSCVDSSSIACSWITFLPVRLMQFPSCTGLDFLLWEQGLFEESYWACSLGGCQDKPWLTNTSKRSRLTEPNISSITEQTPNTHGDQLPKALIGLKLMNTQMYMLQHVTQKLTLYSNWSAERKENQFIQFHTFYFSVDLPVEEGVWSARQEYDSWILVEQEHLLGCILFILVHILFLIVDVKTNTTVGEELNIVLSLERCLNTKMEVHFTQCTW